MADYTNRQLATIIAGVAEEIKTNLKQEGKNLEEMKALCKGFIELNNAFYDKATTIRGILDDGITKMKKVSETPIKVDLSDVNRQYEEKVTQNIEKVNKKLKVPNSSLYVLLTGVACFLLSGLLLYFSTKTKQEIQSEYHSELLKYNVLMKKEDQQLLDDMKDWFDENRNTRNIFLEWRDKKK